MPIICTFLSLVYITCRLWTWYYHPHMKSTDSLIVDWARVKLLHVYMYVPISLQGWQKHKDFYASHSSTTFYASQSIEEYNVFSVKNVFFCCHMYAGTRHSDLSSCREVLISIMGHRKSENSFQSDQGTFKALGLRGSLSMPGEHECIHIIMSSCSDTNMH